jgi:hypothetical protein
MSPTLALILSIVLVLLLLFVFVYTFVRYVKTPAPKGCENLGVDKNKCASCDEKTCRYNLYAEKEKKK